MQGMIPFYQIWTIHTLPAFKIPVNAKLLQQ